VILIACAGMKACALSENIEVTILAAVNKGHSIVACLVGDRKNREEAVRGRVQGLAASHVFLKFSVVKVAKRSRVVGSAS
jgi:hypothetical protein